MKKDKKKGRRKTPEFEEELSPLRRGERELAAGRFAEAISFFKLISPNAYEYGQACKGHGAALLRMRRWSEALTVLQTAHNALPDDPEILVNAGDAARHLGRIGVAETTYNEARKRGADGFQIRFGEAAICEARSRWLEAARLWAELRRSYPDDPRVTHNLGRAWHELGETDRAVTLMAEAYRVSGELQSLSMLAMLAPHAGSCGHEQVLHIRTELAAKLKAAEGNPADAEPRVVKDDRPINIGYVSAFFHRRNWMKPVWALLNNHDRERFNIHLFADGPPDEIDGTGGYTSHTADTIHDTRELGNRDLAKLINDQGIDILVDLNCYSAVPRLGLWTAKPAPVTIGWFNQYATSGLPGIEWLIGDDVVIRPEEENFYTEKIRRLNQSYLSFQVGYDTPEIEIPPGDAPFTFGCLGSAYKITPAVRAAWITLLKETRGTRLLVRNKLLGEETHKKWFLEFFTGEGIDADRLILLGPADHKEFLETYGKIDLALDTFPYNGGTTTMESLWQGVPVVCFAGDRWVSRTCATLIHSAGLNDFIAESEQEYVAIAKTWSERKRDLAELRGVMRARLEASKVCDGSGLARDFERIIFEILGDERHHQNG